jgi:RHS repeat-associated protein
MTTSSACAIAVTFRVSRCTGKERDSESGNDYFGARYYASTMGRFLSPDPKLMTARHLTNPQKWNKYAYVINNPLMRFDPDGMDDYALSARKRILLLRFKEETRHHHIKCDGRWRLFVRSCHDTRKCGIRESNRRLSN